MSNTSARAKLRAEQAKQRSKERRILIIVAAGLVLLIVAAGAGFWFWRANQTPSAGPSASTSPTPANLTNGKPVVFGSANAPVKIAMFEDFKCPHCADFEESYQPVLDQALKAGQISVELYPLAFVAPGSAPAANAFGCAVQAGYGESYFRGLFANNTLDWSDDQLISLLTKVSGAPASSTFTSCVQQKQNAAWVDSIAAVATQRNVTSTPTVFLDGEQLDITTLTPDALQQKIADKAKS